MSKKTNTRALSDGAQYMSRRNVSAAHGSSLKKLRTGARIAHGLRPLKMPTAFTLAQFAGFPTVMSGGRPVLSPVVPPESAFVLFAFAARRGLKSVTEGAFARRHPTKGWRFGAAI